MEENIKREIIKKDSIKINKRKISNGIGLNNVTLCGEFVTSYFAWLPLDKQKEIAEEMNDMGK